MVLGFEDLRLPTQRDPRGLAFDRLSPSLDGQKTRSGGSRSNADGGDTEDASLGVGLFPASTLFPWKGSLPRPYETFAGNGDSRRRDATGSITHAPGLVQGGLRGHARDSCNGEWGLPDPDLPTRGLAMDTASTRCISTRRLLVYPRFVQAAPPNMETRSKAPARGSGPVSPTASEGSRVKNSRQRVLGRQVVYPCGPEAGACRGAVRWRGRARAGAWPG